MTAAAGARTLEGHVALVTGAARGIGRAIALRLAAEGAAVVVSARSGAGTGAFAGSLGAVVGDIEAIGGRAAAVPADLADPGFDRRQLLAAGRQAFGADVDIVVHNAAATRHFEMTFPHMTREAFEESVEVNVWAGWELAAAAVPAMRARGAGWILFISSAQAGPRVGPPYAPNVTNGAVLYGATKAMVDRIVTGAAMELHGEGIAVNALSPERAVATDHAVAVTGGLDPATVEPVETMAEAALALCSGDPAVVTGQVASSLSLLRSMGRPVHTLDGRSLVPGWQPGDIAPERLRTPYLRAMDQKGS